MTSFFEANIYAQVIVTPQLRQLDLSEVVKILRSRIFDLLPGFTGLFTLKCGSGSGGVSDIYGNKFLSAVRNLKLLVHFSLQVRTKINFTSSLYLYIYLPTYLSLSLFLSLYVSLITLYSLSSSLNLGSLSYGLFLFDTSLTIH